MKVSLEREIPGISCTDGGFNRSMQHLISMHYREEDVENEPTPVLFLAQVPGSINK